MSTEEKQQVKEYLDKRKSELSKDKIELFLKELQTQNFPKEYQNQALLLANRNSRLNNSKIDGILSTENYFSEKNKISYSSLSLINSLEEDEALSIEWFNFASQHATRSLQIEEELKKELTMRREKYNEILGSVKYLSWQTLILSKIYNELNFIDVLGWKYPILCFFSTENYKYPFDQVVNEKDLDICTHDYEISANIHTEYKELIVGKIERPLLKGYMLEKLVLDKENKIISISAKVGTYEQNIYTSHILEYELYNLYLNKTKDFTRLKSEEILKFLPIRNTIHKNCSQKEIGSTGVNRNSLLGVQMFVMFKHHDDNSYRVLTIKRTENVAAKPGFFQFIPSGGFEIFHEDDDENVLREHFSLRFSLFRELLEEAFGMEEYIHNYRGVPVENILRHKKILKLTKLLEDNKAHFEFLGSVNDVVCLRHLLAFVLRIDDIEFSRQKFEPNHESRNIRLFKINELHQIINEGKSCNDSAGLLHLVMNNHLYQEVIH